MESFILQDYQGQWFCMKNIERSISLNIIGTSNIVIECAKRNIKVIYFSTNYIYPGVKGNYSETSPLLPLNNYSWSKLGGEVSGSNV